MAEEISVILTADASKLAAELQKAENELRQFQSALKRTGDVAQIEKLQQSIAKTTQQISLLNKTQSQFAGSSNKAAYALNDLSRIAQDAPYGFLGIQNNINPLLESFQRLKGETGSTGGALKALVGALSGPAGLGLAIGAISAAITFAQIGFSRWGASAKKAKSDSDEFNKALDSTKASAMSTGFELQAFVDIAKNSTLPLEQRNEALKEANKILGKHGELLTLTNIGTEKATQQVKLYTQALIGQAVAAKYADRLAELSIKRTNINNRLGLLQIGIDRIKAINAKSAVNATTGQTAGYVQLQDALLDQINSKNDLNTVDQEYNQTLKDLNNSVYTSTLSFSQLGTKVEDTGKKSKKSKEDLDSIAKTLAKLREDLRDQVSLGITFNMSTLKDQADLVKSAITKLITVFNVDPKNAIIINLKADLRDLEMKIKRENVIIPALLKFENEKVKPLDDATLKKALDIPSIKAVLIGSDLANIFSFLPVGFFKPFSTDSVKGLVKDLNKVLENAAETIAINFGETLGNALSGKTNIGDFFVGIFNTIGAAMVEFGKVMIAFAIQVEVIKKWAIANPFLAVAAAVGLIAIGTAIRNKTSKNAFAVGTRNAPGGMALVGERGPELVNIPKGSQVIPAAQTSNMMGSMSAGLEIYGILRGQDIYFSNKKYSATYARTT